MKACGDDSDCRGGYACIDPKVAPISALVLDDDQGKRVCIAVSTVPAGPQAVSTGVPNVCKSGVPTFDIDAGVTPDAAVDAAVDAGAAVDASDAGDDASDAQSDGAH